VPHGGRRRMLPAASAVYGSRPLRRDQSGRAWTLQLIPPTTTLPTRAARGDRRGREGFFQRGDEEAKQQCAAASAAHALPAKGSPQTWRRQLAALTPAAPRCAGGSSLWNWVTGGDSTNSSPSQRGTKPDESECSPHLARPRAAPALRPCCALRLVAANAKRGADVWFRSRQGAPCWTEAMAAVRACAALSRVYLAHRLGELSLAVESSATMGESPTAKGHRGRCPLHLPRTTRPLHR
jgi:hypothetical protein